MTGSLATANIFATYLPEHMTLWQGFLDEVSDQDRRVLGGIVPKDLSLPLQIWGPAWALVAWLCPQWVAMAFPPQVFLTAILQLCLFAITDKKNNAALQGTEALVIGILVCVIGVSLGMNSGYAINPSRDLPPRFFTFIAGWGKPVFRYCPCETPFPSAFWGRGCPCKQRV